MINMGSKRIVLFSLLIMISLLFVLPVHACKVPDISSVKAVSLHPIPQLKFNSSQEEMAVSGELVQEKVSKHLQWT